MAKVQAVTAKDLKQIKALLQSKINELMAEAGKTVIDMAGQEEKLPDLNDRASQESELNLEIRMRERERKLIVKMRETIERIDAGEYGICEECGEPIGVKRLLARPVTTLCIECKTREEKLQKLQGRTPELDPCLFGGLRAGSRVQGTGDRVKRTGKIKTKKDRGGCSSILFFCSFCFLYFLDPEPWTLNPFFRSPVQVFSPPEPSRSVRRALP